MPLKSVPRLKVSVLPKRAVGAGTAERKSAPGGSIAMSLTPKAGFGPRFWIVICHVRLLPSGTGLGVAVAVTRKSALMLLPTTVRQAENSDVLLAGSVAVAVMTYPAGTAQGMVFVKAAS